MWARTLCPLLSSTRNMAFGRASTTVPSISITPSFFGMSSTICWSVVYRVVHRARGTGPGGPGTSSAGAEVDLVQPLVDLIPARANAHQERSCAGDGQPRGTTKQTHVGPTRQSS